MKKFAIVAMLLMLTAGIAWAKSHELKGKVTSKSGDKVTVEVTKGSVDDVSLGDKVEMEVKGSKGKKAEKGGGMLMGC